MFAKFRRAVRAHWVASLAISVLALAGAIGVGFHSCSASREGSAFRVEGAVPGAGEPLALALYQSLGVHFTRGHSVSLLQNGAVFDVLVDQIGRAQHSVHVVMYIWEKGAASDRVVRALVASAQRGVECRLLVDDFGSSGFTEDVAPPLLAAGCEVRRFRPLNRSLKLARNHRKIAVFDGRLAITGGFGVRDNWLGDGIHQDGWRDSNVLFSGPAVADAQQAFAENWQEAGGTLLPAAAFPVQASSGSATAAFVSSTSAVVTRAERLTQLLIAAGKRRIWIANAYFVPSAAVLALLEAKAAGGVDVRLLMPGKNSDSKTSFGIQHIEYGSLITKGAKIWEYTSSMMHAKTMVIDDRLSLVGSINLDPLSLNELEEGSLVVEDTALNAQIAHDIAADCDRSKPIRK